MTEQQELERPVVVEQEKKVDQFKMNLKTVFNKKKSDFIFLEVSVSNELLDLLRNVTVTDEEAQKATYPMSEENDEFKRYKVKAWVMRSIRRNSYAECLFAKPLLDDGVAVFRQDSARAVDEMVSGMKEVMKTVIEVYLRYHKINQTVTYHMQ